MQNANGIVNEGFDEVSKTANFKLNQALVGLKNSATQFGSIIIPVVTNLIDKVNPLIQSFSNLSESKKNVIARSVLLAASLGPILSISGGLISNFAKLRTAVRGVVGIYSIAAQGFIAARSELLEQGVAMSGVTAKVKAARAAFASLNAVQKASVIGLVVAGVGAAVVAFQGYNKELTTAEKSQKRVAEASATIAKFAAEETSTLDKLISKVGDANLRQEERQKALKKLQEIYPDYFNSLDVESVSLNQLAQIQDNLNQKILEGAAARAKSSALNKIAEAQIEKQLRLQEIQRKGIEALSFLQKQNNDPLRLLRNSGESGEDFAIRTAVESLQKDIENLGLEAKQTTADFDALFGVENKKIKTRYDFEDEEFEALNNNNNNNNTNTNVGGLGLNRDLAANADSEAQALARLKAEREAYTAVTIIANEATKKRVVANEDIITQEQLIALQFQEASARQTEFLEGYNAETEAREKRIEQLDREAKKMANMTSIADAMGNALASASDQGVKGFGKLALAALASAAKVIKAQIQAGVAAAVKGALTNVPFPANLIAAGIAGGAASALFSSAISAIGIPALAEGGIAYGPTLALVGEYGGAAGNPEVIAPLDKLQEIMKSSAGGGGAVQVFGRLEGNDILLSSEGAAASRQRREGY